MISLRLIVTLMSMRALCAVSAELPFPGSDDLDWEDFQSAIAADDCFGSHCGRDSTALSMLQLSALIKPRIHVKNASSEELKEELETSATADEVPMDDLSAAMMSEDIGVEATSLIQTDARYERSQVAPNQATMTASVQVDGSFEMNPQSTALPSEGIAYFSVDEHGGSHSEAALSLMQTDAHIERKATSSRHVTEATAVNADGSFEINPQKVAVPSDGIAHISVDAHGDFSGDEALSLMQTEAHIERKAASSSSPPEAAAVNADGTFEMHPQKAALPNDGLFHMSVDAHGDFHGDEALSLMQTEAHIEHKGVTSFPEIDDAAFADDDVYGFGTTAEEGSVSLMQTGFHIERVNVPSDDSAAASAVNADGTLEMKPQKVAAPENGIMHLSVDSHGVSHLEM